jgi:hypothetical protein
MRKLQHAAVIMCLISTPAFSAATKTDNDVTFTCEVTGSDKDGFSLTAKNDGKVDRSCTASCRLTGASNKKTQEWNMPKSGTTKVKAQTDPSVRSGAPRIYFGGEAGLKEDKPYKDPEVTKASCK